MDELDPLRLDRALLETALRARAWGRRLRRGAGLDEDPFALTRWAAGKSMFDTVAALSADDPLREALMRWVYRLSETRINQAVLVRTTFELRHEPRSVEGVEPPQLSLADLLARGLSDRSERRPHWFSAYGRYGASFASLVRLFWERRAEIARRMGLESPDVLCTPAPDLTERAERWLAQTDDAFAALDCHGVPAVVERALGLGVADGWPGRLLLRTLTELIGQPELFRSLDLDPGDFPPAVAPASFLRGLRRLGAAWVRATAPTDQPFVIRHDAYGLRERSIGTLFSTLPLNEEFARRQLGVPRDGMADFQRNLAQVALLETRFGAIRWLLHQRALAGAQAFQEAFADLTERALGAPLPGALAGALLCPSVDEGQRLCALFVAARHEAALTLAHDADWFRNPRGVDQLRSEASLSPDLHVEPQVLDEGESLLLGRLTATL